MIRDNQRGGDEGGKERVRVRMMRVGEGGNEGDKGGEGKEGDESGEGSGW